MKRMFRDKRMYILLAAIPLLIILYLVFRPRQDAVSKRTSEYLTMSDGTRLAYNLFLPTKDKVPANGPFPTLFKYTPYNRTWTIFNENGDFLLDLPGAPWYFELMMRARKLILPLVIPGGNGNVRDALQNTEWLGDILESGYAVVVVDRPGTGASFGKLANDPDAVASELDEILNWIADQTWCDGNIGDGSLRCDIARDIRGITIFD